MRRADGLRAVQVDLRALARREHDDLLLRARDGDVEAPLAAGSVEGSEVHEELSVRTLRVADREQDHVPFVALHVLEVLDEERLLARVREEVLELRIRRAPLFEDVLDERLLRHRERDDACAAALPRGIRKALEHVVDKRLRLGFVRAARLRVVDAVLDVAVRNAKTRSGARSGERAEPVVVVVVVRERDERLVAASVVPAEVSGVKSRRKAFVEDALKVLVPFFVFLSRLALLEEVRRRHLLRVSHHDALLRARDDADRVPHRNLRRLVEDDQVERRLGGQILRDGERAHQEARLEAPDHGVRLGEQLADRLLARLLRALAAYDPELASVRAVAEPAERKRLREPRAHRVLHELRVFGVKATELHDLLLALKSRKRRERRFDAQDLV